MVDRSVILRGSHVLKEDGMIALSGKGLRYVGRKLEESRLKKRKESVVENYTSDTKYLNVGGGKFVREHWRVLDHPSTVFNYDTVFVDFDVDLESEDTWPIESSDFDLVYSSHTLEHLSTPAIENTLSECFRVLKPGGTLRIEVPDMDLIMNHYERGNLEWFEEVLNPREWTVDTPWRDNTYVSERVPEGFELEFYLIHTFATHLAKNYYNDLSFEQVRSDADDLPEREFFERYVSRVEQGWQRESPLHQNWFTNDRLKSLLKSSGFSQVQESACRQSTVPEMCFPEFDTRPRYSVYVEGTKELQ